MRRFSERKGFESADEPRRFPTLFRYKKWRIADKPMLYKQLTAKRWAKLQGENLWKAKFVLMASLGLLFKSGQLSAEEVVER